MKVALVLPDVSRGWIIEKMAVKLSEGLRALGVDAQVQPAPVASADVNHFMMFHRVEPQVGTVNTVAVTHVDDQLKVDMVKRHLSHGVDAAICMSSMTAEQLAAFGAPRQRLTVALPAHDGVMSPRRLIIGITSACYSDGRKREWMLTKLAGDLALDDFAFQFFGSGWDEVAASLRAAGAQVDLHPPSGDYLKDYADIQQAVPHFDYYFYAGLDEGSLGTLDALAVGVKTIVTRQGFHLDLPNGITHGFWDYPEMLQIFQDLAAERQARVAPVRTLTWDRYARRHLEIWTSLIETGALPDYDRLGDAPASQPPAPYEVLGYRAVMANPFRREMALNFWIPGPYKAYRSARRLLGGLVRGAGLGPR